MAGGSFVGGCGSCGGGRGGRGLVALVERRLVEGRVRDRVEECLWTLSFQKTCLASKVVPQALASRSASRARHENLSLLLLLDHHLDVHLHQPRFAENLQSSLASHLNILKVNTDYRYMVESYCLLNRECMQWSSRMAANAPLFCRRRARSTRTLRPTAAPATSSLLSVGPVVPSLVA